MKTAVKVSNAYPYCDGNLPRNIQNVVQNFSEEKSNAFYAMQELACFHNNRYGIGDKFCLKTNLEAECEFVTPKETISQGGSKKAVLLNDGRVAMFPNIDENRYTNTAHWWSDSVHSEAAVATFLEKLEVPALNRKEAWIFVESHDNNAKSYKLPVLLADSFEQYAAKGWYVYDSKKPSEGFFHPHADKWDLKLSSWQSVVTPLITDMAKLASNDFSIGDDGANLVLIDEQGVLELHYFGFDFGGKFGSMKIESEPVTEIKWDDKLCSLISYRVKYMTSSFIMDSMCISSSSSDYCEKVDKFSTQAGKYFSDCNFMKTAVEHHADYDSMQTDALGDNLPHNDL